MTHPHFSQKAVLTQAGAAALIGQALLAAQQRGLAVSAAVVDAAGQLLAFTRMDGASPVSVDVAIGKARTAALIGAPSAVFEQMINGGQTAMATVPGLLPLQGGEPVSQGETVVGALGVSGSTGENDALVAGTATRAFINSKETEDVA